MTEGSKSEQLERLDQIAREAWETVEDRAADLIAEELSLRDLRKAMNRTQVQVAKALKVGQDTVSRYEQRSDMLLSTLQGYVQAMGGELQLVVTFPNRKPVKLKTLGEFAD